MSTENITKEDLIEQIKSLITYDNSQTQINQNYLQYFEYEELLEIKQTLEYKKENQDFFLNNMLDDIYASCK